MSEFRFEVGAAVMCNLGPSGWKLGRVVALRYREDHWPPDVEAPYQVLLEEDDLLIYVPEDDDRYCREVTRADLGITRRIDALAELPPGPDPTPTPEASVEGVGRLGCTDDTGYRSGRCHCCDGCPRNWSAVELYSEHYRCAARNGLKVTRRSVDLGTLRVGDDVHLQLEGLPSREGFMQCPTWVRLPPGVRCSDDGSLEGEVRFDPHRGPTYTVVFVAVSTADWDDPEVGLVRLEVTFVVEGNTPPEGFDVHAFQRRRTQARATADGILDDLIRTWGRWELRELGSLETRDLMCADLGRLRALLEQHPRLGGGLYWARLGGFHMNVHKLLEDALFECELYLGHALTFGDAEIRWMAERNLEGCYAKRQLEAARFMWNDGARQMMRGEWQAAAQTFHLAAAKKDGWGWAVNYGDIWLAEAVARILHGATHDAADETGWVAEASRLLEACVERANDSGMFGPEGHPWASEVDTALTSYLCLRDQGADTSDWLGALEARTIFWCAQVLSGAPPFPPKTSPRRTDDPQDRSGRARRAALPDPGGDPVTRLNTRESSTSEP